MGENNFDIVILGAGIAGLLVGSELSKKHSVLILEKEKDLPRNKYWLTDKISLSMNADFGHCVDSEYHHMDYIAYDGTNYRCMGEYCLWDTTKLLAHLKRIIELNGGSIVTSHRFFGYRDNGDHLSLFANDSVFCARLAIDCMGYASPLIHTCNVVSIAGYYILHGATIALREPIDPIGLHNLLLDSKATYIEVFPSSDNMAHIVLIMPDKAKSSPSGISSDFDFITQQSPYRKYFHGSDRVNQLSGIIPVGMLRKKALNRIYFFGEAGQVHPAATATGLTRMLMKYKETCDFLSEKLQEDALDRHSLELNSVDCLSPYNRRLHLHLFKTLVTWNSRDFRRLILDFNRLDNHDFVNDVIFGSLDIKKYLRGQGLASLINSGSGIILKSLVKSFFY